MNKVLSDERLGAKLRVTENRCVIFNRSTYVYIYIYIYIYKVTVSYSCMDNMKSIINKHNKKVTNADNDTSTDNQVQCNWRNKDQCPLDNKCLTSSIIYNAQVTTNNATKNYIGLTEGTFKQRFSQHKAKFKHRKYTNSTELSKYIWKLRDNNQDFNIKWTIISRARPYNNISKRCDLCLTEKLMIITANPDRILNKRSELISKCRHENKFLSLRYIFFLFKVLLSKVY